MLPKPKTNQATALPKLLDNTFGQVKILIVNYNTQKLTDACINSINLHTANTKIYVFDNSDKTPFVNNHKNVKVIDNTVGQIINFDKWLQQYPKRNFSYAHLNNFASAKHCISIQSALDMIGDNVILMDSDIIVKKDIRELIDDNFCYVGLIEKQINGHKRVLPYICYINYKYCKKHNIPFFDDKYMHGLYYSNEGDSYDTGGAFFVHTQNHPSKLINIFDYVIHFHHGSWTKTGITHSEEDFLEQNKIYYTKHMNNKTVVYTCTTGGYDCLNEMTHINPNFDYVCFTDDHSLTSNTWTIRYIDNPYNLSNVKLLRYVKVNAHKMLPEYETSIWLDANVTTRNNLQKLIDSLNFNKYEVFIQQHPERDCIYKEGDACIKLRKDTADNINKQLSIYKAEGFPKKFGLTQTNIMIRKHNSPDCIKLMELWWEQIEQYSHRDQLSLHYCEWKLNYNKLFKMPKLTGRMDSNFIWKTHHKYTPVKKVMSMEEYASKPIAITSSNQLNNTIDFDLLKHQQCSHNIEETLKKIKQRLPNCNFNDPETIQDKIQWLKVYDSNKLKSFCADKVNVHKYCEHILGKDICIPLIAVYDKIEHIEWDKLPQQFVVKCNHGSGMNIIVSDKRKMNKDEIVAKLMKWMKTDFAYQNICEVHYTDIDRKILVEKFMVDDKLVNSLIDYKFWCFNGEPKMYTMNAGFGHGYIMYYDMNHNKLDLYGVGNKGEFDKPQNFELMKQYAEKLSKDFKLVRVDFYEIDGTVYLGELTFTPGSGKFRYSKKEYDKIVGDMLKL